MGNNFEKHIKKSMDNPPEFPFDEGLWKDMESRLNEKSDRKPLFGPLASLFLVLLTLLATSLAGYFYFKAKGLEKHDLVEQQQLQNQSEPEAIIEKRVTVLYDTIYNRVVIDQVQKRNDRGNNHLAGSNAYMYSPDFALSFKLEDFLPSNYSNSRSFSNLRLGVQPYAAESKSGQNKFSKNQSDIEGEVLALFKDNFFEKPVASLPGDVPGFLEIDHRVNLPEIVVQKHKRKYRMRYYLGKMRPTRFILSGTTGTFASLNLGSIGFNLRGSAHVEVGFGKRFSIITGVEYFANDFSKKINLTNDPFADAGFPELPPNNSEDELKNIQGDFNYLQIPFGIKHTIFPRRYFYPYLAGGIIYGRTARSRLEYQYESLSLQSLYTVSRGNLEPRNFDLSAVWGTLGFQVQMNRNWSLLIEGSAQFDFKNGIYKYENLDLLKFNTGVQYKF